MTRAVACAPGRVNLIGEHTDYNDGFVMPIAIDRTVCVEVRGRANGRIGIASKQFGGEDADFDASALPEGPRGHWSDGVRGVVLELQRKGVEIEGADIRIDGTIPVGAGLGSSAAVLVATALALLDALAVRIDASALARLAQRAENFHAGARSGIMDQFVSASAQAGHALLLDTRSLQSEQLPLAGDVRVVVCNTMRKHHHASGEYNLRREQCEAGLAILRERFPALRSLRDTTMVQLNAVREAMDPVIYRRCHHVIAENTRVIEATAALEADDRVTFGRLMDESHASLRDDYEVSSRELDAMVTLARSSPGVYGARMTGGGFGGCAIALAQANHVAAIVERVRDGYTGLTGVTPDVFATSAHGGAAVRTPQTPDSK